MAPISGQQAWPAVAKFLGIDREGVIRLTLTVNTDEAVQVNVTSLVTGLQEVSEVTEQFNLVPVCDSSTCTADDCKDECMFEGTA